MSSGDSEDVFGILKTDVIDDSMSIFPKVVYSINGKYLPFDRFVGKTVRIEIIDMED